MHGPQEVRPQEIGETNNPTLDGIDLRHSTHTTHTGGIIHTLSLTEL